MHHSNNNSVCVVGLGYIGLPTALLLANAGNRVFGYDVDTQKISGLIAGKLPFSEPGLTKLFTAVQSKNTFTATSILPEAHTYIIAVPTPHTGNSADLKYVTQALDAISSVFPNYGTVVIESTVGPRDCADILEPKIRSWNKSYSFAHCPERAIPGNTLHEMVHNDRIVGGSTKAAAMEVAKLYKTFVKGTLHTTTTTIAASCKVMENTYRAVNIALANEFAAIASKLQFDVWEAIELANKHPRVHIHAPGPGVGGHCIPIDPWFFTSSTTEPSVISAALKRNELMPQFISGLVTKQVLEQKLSKPTIGVMGVAYKKNVDDTRESPAFPLIRVLSEKYQVLATDPHVTAHPQQKLTPLNHLLESADILIVVTDHDAFSDIKFEKFPKLKVIIDTRNCLQSRQLQNFSGTVVRLGDGA